MAGVVEAEAVELDGDVLAGPAAVDVVAVGQPVRLRQWQAGLGEALDEALLQLGQKNRGVTAGDGSEGGRALRPRVTLQDRFDVLRADAVNDVGQMAGAGE